MKYSVNNYFLDLYKDRFERLRVDFWEQEDILRNFNIINPFINRIENEIDLCLNYQKTIVNLKEERSISEYLDSLSDILTNTRILKYQYSNLIQEYNNEIKIYSVDNSNKIKGIEKIIFNNSKEKEILVFQNYSTYYFEDNNIKTEKNNFKYKKSYDDLNLAIKDEQIDKFTTYFVLNDKFLNLNSTIIPIVTSKFILGDVEILDDIHKII